MKANLRNKNLHTKIYLLSICLFIINGCLNDATAKLERSTAANAVHRRSITATVSPLKYCAGGSVSVSYKITGTYNAGNVFTAQLSNARGSFTSPKSIGTLKSTTAGTISATIPANTPAGTGYRIRVVSSSPAITGSNNGSNITINASVTATSSSNSPVCSGSILDLSSGGGTSYSWTGPDGFTSSQQDITVSNVTSANVGIYTVTVTNAGGCTAIANTTVIIGSPATPVVTPVNNCNGTATLTASGYTGSLLWNTGATIASITVTAAGTYSVTQTVSGCTSAAGTATASPQALPPTPVVTPVNNCNGKSTLTASSYTGNLLWNTGATTASITVTTAGTYSVTQTIGGCTSAAGTGNAIIGSPLTPVVTPVNNCGTSTLTASGYTGSLLWNTGVTVASITVTAAGTYSVTQTVSGCTSAAGTAAASPKALPATPPISVTNNCNGTSTLITTATGNFVWSTGDNVDQSITVTTAGTYNLTITGSNGCTSTGTGYATPLFSVTPVVTPVNNCNGSSTLTASGYTGSLLWSTGATTASIIVTATGTYSVTQTVSGCTSTAGTGYAATVAPPTPVVTPVNNCNGSSTLTASGYTGSLLWNTGATIASITVTAAGTYSVTQTVSGCTSAAGTATASPQALPATPVVSPVNNCGASTLTASGYTGSLLWNTGATTVSITVTTAGTYSVTQTVSGCTSAAGIATASPQALPATPVVSPVNNCGASTLTASGYTGSLLWNTGATTISITVTTAGTYSVTQTVSGCTSAAGTATASPQALPPTPVVTPVNNCATSTLTASGYTGSLLWNTGASTASITVAAVGTYSVTQTVSGCTSAAGTATASPQALPATPVVSPVNNCGASTLTASGYTGSLLWNTGATTVSITVTTAGTYSVTQTVSGCTSAAGIATASPQALPATPVVSPVNNCGASTLTASGYTGSLLWNTGATTAFITVTATAIYSVTQTVNGCTSAAGTATASPQVLPSTPVVSPVNNCGASTLTASGYTGSLLWNTGATTASITVTATGIYSVTQTVSGCTGATGTTTASPLSLPATPQLSVTNNCDGTSTLSTTATGNFVWSTGDNVDQSITVTTAGTYSLTVTGSNGCTSTGAGYASATLSVAPVVTPVNNCDGTSTLTASGYTGSLLWNTGATTASITVTATDTYSVTETVSGCTSASGTGYVTTTPPPTPVVTPVNNCDGTSTLTASVYEGNLLWNTGETTASITVTTTGTYSVTETLSGCTSASGTGYVTTTPPPIPVVTPVNNCDGTSTLTASGYTGSLLWNTGATTASITVTATGTYSVTETVGGCTSASGTGYVTTTPPPIPVVTPVNNCDGTSTLTASGYTGSLLWNTGATTAYITVIATGTYSVTETVSGCTSASGTGYVTTTPPPIPVVTPVNNCDGTSTLTASVYEGNLLWNTGATTASITVTTTGTYSVTQTVSGCNSASGTGYVTTTPPPIPVVTPVNNCDGTSTLTASGYTGNLLWNTGETTVSISVITAGTYSVTQTVSGCTSGAGTGNATIGLPSTPVITAVNNCDGTSTLTASSYAGSLLWNSGATTISITVTTVGTYSVTQTVGGCTSASGTGYATTALPSAPIAAAVNNCGSSIVTASSYAGSLLWNTGATTSSITVTATGTYSITQTVSGCMSAAGTATASPKALPAIPFVSVVNDCIGSSTLTTTVTGNFVWSTGDHVDQSITVTTAGTYSLTVTGSDGCTSTGTGYATAGPPSTPVVTAVNNCGASTLTASGYMSNLLWNTGATTVSITVTTAGTYSVTQTVGGCISASGTGLAAPVVDLPLEPVVTVNNTYNCASGLAAMVASGYTGTLHWNNGSTASAIVTGAAATWMLYSTIASCNSTTVTAVTAPVATPAKPVVTVQNYCNSTSVLTTASTGSLLWSNGATTSSITVTADTTYYVTATASGCPASSAGKGIATPFITPLTPAVTDVDNCGYSILYTTATGALLWSTGASTSSIIVTSAGAYSITTTNASGCTSPSGGGTANPINLPPAPTPSVTDIDNCGNSILTAGSYSGSLLWNTGATTSSITVTSGGAYSVTQTINICTSLAGTAIASPIFAPGVSANNSNGCSGPSYLTVTNNYPGASLTWNTGATTSSITVTIGGTYSVTQTANGCTSSSGTVVASITPPSPVITVYNSYNCASGLAAIVATSYTGALHWNNGSTASAIVTGVAATWTLYSTIGGCNSPAVTAVTAPIVTPAAPVVTVQNYCNGTSVLSTTSAGSLLWTSGAATTSSITVSAAGTYYVTTASGSCTSNPGKGIAAPLVTPSAPSVTDVDNCGYSALSTTATGSLLWSTGASTSSITVTSAGAYTVTTTNVSGCTSPPGSGTANPINLPPASAPSVTDIDNCGNSILTAGSYSGSLLWNTGATTSSITVTNGGIYSVTQTINVCTSAAGTATAFPILAPVITSVNSNGCSGPAILTANNIYSGASLTWNTGATTSSITVTAGGGGTYKVTQTANGCTSLPGIVVVSVTPAAPVITVNNAYNCAGSASLVVTGYSGILHWNNGSSATAIVTGAAATWTLYQTVGSCNSPSITAVTAPVKTPTKPGAITAPSPSPCASSTVTNPGTYYTYSITAVAGATSYIWTVPSGFNHTSLTTTVPSLSVTTTNAVAGNITVAASNICGTSSASTYAVTFSCRESGTGTEAGSMNMAVYPNPAHDKLNVDFNSNTKGEYVIEMIDITGRLLLDKIADTDQGQNHVEFEIGNFAKGIYILSFSSGDENRQVRVVVE